MPTYEVLLARHYAVRITIEADSEDAARTRVDTGDWSDSDITDNDLVDTTICEVELAHADELVTVPAWLLESLAELGTAIEGEDLQGVADIWTLHIQPALAKARVDTP